MEQRRLNEDLDKLSERLSRIEEEKMKILNEYEQEKSALTTKIHYM